MNKLERPKILKGKVIKVATGCGNIYIGLNRHEGRLFEVFATLGKAGGCPKCQLEAITRSITLGLRYGIPPREYVKELEELSCPNTVWWDGQQIRSCPDAIAKLIREEEK